MNRSCWPQKVQVVRGQRRINTGRPDADWNTNLDVHAWIALCEAAFRSFGIPAPASTVRQGWNRTPLTGRSVIGSCSVDLPQPLRAYFDYAFHHLAEGTSSGPYRAGFGRPSREKVLAGQRNMWSTASLIMAAGRVLVETSDGWRFVAKERAGGLKLQLLEMLPIACEVEDNGVVRWSPPVPAGQPQDLPPQGR